MKQAPEMAKLTRQTTSLLNSAASSTSVHPMVTFTTKTNTTKPQFSRIFSNKQLDSSYIENYQKLLIKNPEQPHKLVDYIAKPTQNQLNNNSKTHQINLYKPKMDFSPPLAILLTISASNISVKDAH